MTIAEGGVSLGGGLCLGVSVQGGLCLGGSPYKESEKRAARILLECFLVLVIIFSALVMQLKLSLIENIDLKTYLPITSVAGLKCDKRDCIAQNVFACGCVSLRI